MLTITVTGPELYDESISKFIKPKGDDLLLEHSLVSLSKWEAQYEKPFLGKEEKTHEETLEYIRIMTIAPVMKPEVYQDLSPENYGEISRYIDRKMTATWFGPPPPGRPSNEVVTAEIIYYWMIALKIPQEYQYWHLNRLITLIKVLNQKNSPPKKVPMRDMAAQRRALNEKRLAEQNTTG